MEKIELMDKHRIRRSLKRIAYQIAERNRDEKQVLLVGIDKRGYAVASLLEEFLAPLYDGDCMCEQLLPEGDEEPVLPTGPVSPAGLFIVLVDDVIFSGNTMFNALVSLSRMIDLQEVHTAFLVDRGHRKFPVEAEFTGMELPTKLDEHVAVEMEGKTGIKQVVLYNKKT